MESEYAVRMGRCVRCLEPLAPFERDEGWKCCVECGMKMKRERERALGSNEPRFCANRGCYNYLNASEIEFLFIWCSKCRSLAGGKMPITHENKTGNQQILIALTKREAAWLMYALGLATGGVRTESTVLKEMLHLSNRVSSQMPDSLSEASDAKP